MTHVFLAALGAAFGEALHGVRLAEAAHAAGERAIFLGPAGLHPLLSGSPVRFGRIDGALPRLHSAVADVVRAERADSLVLVDLAGVAQASLGLGFDLHGLLDCGAPVISLDCWDLASAGVVRDLGPEDQPVGVGLDAPFLRRRLLPAPFVRPDLPGAYDALPALAPPAAAERAYIRAELGLAPEQRLILWPSARWQHPQHQDQADRRRLAQAVPQLLLAYLSSLPDSVVVLHVGPAPFAPQPLGPRYHHLEQVPPVTFHQLLGAADLLLCANAAATTLGTALCLGVPVLLLQSAAAGATQEQVASSLGISLSERVARWLPTALPLHPLRACPLSLHRFLTPVMDHNPLYGCLRQAQLLDEDAVRAALHELLFQPDQAAAQRARQDRYVAQVRRLPDGLTRLRALLDQPGG